MPKMKTHSGTKKRVKQTGSGKLMHEQVNKRHRLEVKTSKRSRKLRQDSAVSAADSKNVKRLLGMR
jgi:large subunit ribosomal protein L35